MQGTKLPRAKLWIAGVSTLAILMGCEAQPVKEQAANGNEYKVPSQSKAEGDQARGGQLEEAHRHAGAAPPPAALGAEPSAEMAQGIAPASPAAPAESSSPIIIVQGL